MNLKYLGTAAAEGIPALFCKCENCEKARRLGEYRSRAQALIDQRLLIDFGPDTFMHTALYNLDLGKIKNILITHAHSDHVAPDEIRMFQAGYSHPSEGVLKIYCTPAAKKRFSAVLQSHNIGEDLVSLVPVSPFVTFRVSDYTVTPLKAAHAAGTDPVFYVISDKEKTLMYCHDTSFFPEETWDYLQNNPFHADYVSLDCTEGTRQKKSGSHMTLQMNIEVRQRLLQMGIADKSTVFCTNHFSHNGIGVLPSEMKEIAADNGFISSFDGMEVEI